MAASNGHRIPEGHRAFSPTPLSAAFITSIVSSGSPHEPLRTAAVNFCGGQVIHRLPAAASSEVPLSIKIGT
jgi:hypothetical protein